MRIYRMTATFGKLENATLELEPGLNVLEAPNEWGKSTWCAFLIAMFYGMDTRAKSTKTALADKERYAPWSGSPMAGRVELNWKGRDITIERCTRGRVPMGEFRAYETKTGLELPELTSANCGLLLLGVEQSVFRRSAFIRQTDMPVTRDEALRRRLNDLVTTGDESGEADRLEQELREIRNRCRYHRSGLLPQAEERCRELEDRLGELESLESHSRKLKRRLGEVNSWRRALENHGDALRYAAAEADAARVAQAQELCDHARQQLISAEENCRKLPPREEAEKKTKQLQEFCEEWNTARIEQTLAPEPPVLPELPLPFRGMELKQAEKMAAEDSERFEQLSRKKPQLVFWIPAWAAMLLSAAAVLAEQWLAAGICGLSAMALLVLGVVRKNRWNRNREQLLEKYGAEDPSRWMLPLSSYQEKMTGYEQAMAEYRAVRGDLDIRMTFLNRQRQSLCGSQRPEKVLELWQQILDQWERYDHACRELERAEQHLQVLRAMAKPVCAPAAQDDLTFSAEETEELLRQTMVEQQRLHSRLGQYQGRMECLGNPEELREKLCGERERMEKLEQIYRAAELGLETLEKARQELQRRFAPRISRRAQELMGLLTAGRYDRLRLDGDLSLLAGTQEDMILRDLLWRSEGTIDQLYTALRLAVAEEVVPEAPLVLDDAFVRFDDIRLAAVLKILRQQAKSRQVILFTCQGREKRLLQTRE